jgi:hypothetical protein
VKVVEKERTFLPELLLQLAVVDSSPIKPWRRARFESSQLKVEPRECLRELNRCTVASPSTWLCLAPYEDVNPLFGHKADEPVYISPLRKVPVVSTMVLVCSRVPSAAW